MKALVHTEPYKFEFKDVPQPRPGDEEILVRVKAVGICGSDVHGYTGKTGRRIPPIIMGHEASGVVEAVGKTARNVAVKDRITFDSTVYCNQCSWCRQGRVNLCDNRMVLGVSIPAFRRDGCLAEYVVMPWWITYKLPDAVSFEEAALVEPAAVSMHAARITPIDVNDVVAVIGAGPIGLFAIQAAKVKGAGRVIAFDVREERLVLARQLGADITINPSAGDVVEELKRVVGRPDVDAVLEAVGIPSAFDLAFKIIKRGGHLTLIGNVTPQLTVNWQDLIMRELNIRGSFAIAGEYRAVLDLMAQGRIQAKPLISQTRPLSEGQAAFDILHKGDPGLFKIVLHP
jgi:2-desacetyl-2-hydroxyethyl bacteriochlorophyllide A dehydrogenase